MGVSRQDFYDMTFGEVADLLEENSKQKAHDTYNNAILISAFTVKRLNRQNPPQIHDLYPDLFIAPEDDYETNELLFRQWANNWNLTRGKQ